MELHEKVEKLEKISFKLEKIKEVNPIIEDMKWLVEELRNSLLNHEKQSLSIDDSRFKLVQQKINLIDLYRNLDNWKIVNQVENWMQTSRNEIIYLWFLLSEKKLDVWVITYYSIPYPTSYGKLIAESNHDTFIIEFEYGLEYWDKTNCKLFLSKEEAEKEYNDFRNNKNNYAPEG